MKKVHPMRIAKNSSSAHLEGLENASQNIRCRFCKQSIQDHQYLPSPCQCPESIHPNCIPEEMHQAMRGEIVSDRNIRKYPCKRCKTMIRFTNKERLHCRTFSEFCKYCRNNQGMCTWLTIGTLAIVILAVFLVILLLQPQIISESFSYNSVLIAIAITLGILFIIVCFFCCSSLLCQRIPSVTILPAPSHRKHGSNLEIANYQ